MNPVEFNEKAAWIATVLVLLQIPLGLGLRRLRGTGNKVRRWIHIASGLFLVPMALAHGWWSMHEGSISRANATGLWFATAAVAIVLLQLVSGTFLLSAFSSRARGLRRSHLVLSFALLLALGLHLFLNG